jgi:hypothetical protein
VNLFIENKFINEAALIVSGTCQAKSKQKETNETSRCSNERRPKEKI